MKPTVRSPKKGKILPESSVPVAKDPETDEKEMTNAVEQIHRSFQPTKKAKPKRRHVYRVGALKVPLSRAENMRGGRGKFARRLKVVLARMSAPKKPLPDFDVVEPPRRSPRAGRHESIPRHHESSWVDEPEGSDENE